MVGINGIGGIPEPANPRRAQGTDNKIAAQAPNATDGDEALFSDEAKEAASLGRMIEAANQQSEVRAEAIERARQNLEKGVHQILDVVRVVAARIAMHLESIDRPRT